MEGNTQSCEECVRLLFPAYKAAFQDEQVKMNGSSHGLFEPHGTVGKRKEKKS